MKKLNVKLTNKKNNLILLFQLTVFTGFGILTLFSGQAFAQQETCTPSTTVTEGDLAPGGIVSFIVFGGPNSVTVDHIDGGTGLQSLTVVRASNAEVNIPTFSTGTFDPVVPTFSVIYPNLPVDFTLRAANTTSSIFIRVRCACVPPLIISEDPSMFPGGLNAFESITAGTNSITITPHTDGSGMQLFSMVNARNAVINMPSFTPGTHHPQSATFTVIDRTQPVEFTLRATNEFHGVFVRVIMTSCGSHFVTDASSQGSAEFFTVTPPDHITASGTIMVNTINDATGLQSLEMVNSSNAMVHIPTFKDGTIDPVAITYTKINPDAPSCITLRASSGLHSIFIVLCSC